MSSKDDIYMTRKDKDEAEQTYLPNPATQRRPNNNHPVSLIAAVIAFYFIISLSVVFLNKIIMSGSDFNYALFVTWYQLVVALVLLLIFAHLGRT
jgi:GDP-fucose transporter C1